MVQIKDQRPKSKDHWQSVEQRCMLEIKDQRSNITNIARSAADRSLLHEHSLHAERLVLTLQ